MPKRFCRDFARLLAVLLPMVLFCWSTCALAGGGPEGVLLVVNERSQGSLTIANHYARLRQIPADNLLYLRWDPKAQTTDIDTFRRQILTPVLDAIESRHLADQIDCVVYSSDFPWGITLDSDIRKFTDAMTAAAKLQGGKAEDKSGADKPAAKHEWPKHLTATGSLTGLTFLWQPVKAGYPAYFEMQSNRYVRRSTPEQRIAPSEGFRGNRQFNAQGEAVASGGRRYFLSAMLGVTSGRGNSQSEVLDYLQRSAAADGTHPRGTIYFMKNGDVRSTVRHELFPAAVEELKKLGVAAEIIEGTVPVEKTDVQGTVMGAATFDWKASQSTILPGAICEHFTSFGGILSDLADQTPLSEFLRYGAAGASGTVTEPYAIAEKFPSPMIQVHYARGCTLIESFYQSVHGPYQLLIVGDPLCRPWADIPQVSVTGVEPDAEVRGSLTLKPAAALTHGEKVDRFELFFDGLRVASCKPDATVTFDTTRLADGHHELRMVGVGPEPIASQGRAIIPVRVANHGRKIEASLVTKEPLNGDKPITIAVRCAGAIGIIALQGNRIVGRIGGDEGQIEIPQDTLGTGPVQLSVAGLGNGGPQTNVLAEPLDLTVQ
jgi:uncharacterized protein (TIGR03790 family)